MEAIKNWMQHLLAQVISLGLLDTSVYLHKLPTQILMRKNLRNFANALDKSNHMKKKS